MWGSGSGIQSGSSAEGCARGLGGRGEGELEGGMRLIIHLSQMDINRNE